jgi:hypothetical protein
MRFYIHHKGMDGQPIRRIAISVIYNSDGILRLFFIGETEEKGGFKLGVMVTKPVIEQVGLPVISFVARRFAYTENIDSYTLQ